MPNAGPPPPPHERAAAYERVKALIENLETIVLPEKAIEAGKGHSTKTLTATSRRSQ